MGSDKDARLTIDVNQPKNIAHNHEHSGSNEHASHWDNKRRSPAGRNPRNTWDKMPPGEDYSLEWVWLVIFGSRFWATLMPQKFRTSSHVEKYDR